MQQNSMRTILSEEKIRQVEPIINCWTWRLAGSRQLSRNSKENRETIYQQTLNHFENETFATISWKGKTNIKNGISLKSPHTSSTKTTQDNIYWRIKQTRELGVVYLLECSEGARRAAERTSPSEMRIRVDTLKNSGRTKNPPYG